MQYYSLNKQSPEVGFREALFRGLAPDRGLYFPSEIPVLPEDFWRSLPFMEPVDMASALLSPFVEEELNESQLRQILEEVLHFDIPLHPLRDNLYSLELFHGPTLAFKDVGALFMARCLGTLAPSKDQRLTILVATSGDTGGAVANGFLGVEGVEVVILYPSEKVSALQEQQLTTLGQNITALEVEGSFDDCQAMVKTAFLDQEITDHRLLSSANSINIGRWLPQMLYYVSGDPSVSVGPFLRASAATALLSSLRELREYLCRNAGPPHGHARGALFGSHQCQRCGSPLSLRRRVLP